MWMNWMGTFNAGKRLLLTEKIVVFNIAKTAINSRKEFVFSKHWIFIGGFFYLSKWKNNKFILWHHLMTCFEYTNHFTHTSCNEWNGFVSGLKKSSECMCRTKLYQLFNVKLANSPKPKFQIDQRSSENGPEMSLMINFTLFVWLFWSIAGSILHITFGNSCSIWVISCFSSQNFVLRDTSH